MKVRSVKGGWLMDEAVEAFKRSWLKTLDW